jgi:hypothetical protein
VPIGQLGGGLKPAALPVLFPAGKKDVLLADQDWPFQLHHVGPEVWESSDGTRDVRLHAPHHRKGVQLEPLAVLFQPPSRRNWLEPVQGFVLWFRASPRYQQNGRISWEVADEDGRPDEIARWVPDQSDEFVGVLEVRRDTLLDFMREFDLDLAVFYDENRSTTEVAHGWRDDEQEAHRSWRVWATDVMGDVRVVIRCVTVLLRPPPLRSDPNAVDLGQTLEYVVGLDPDTGEKLTLSYPGDPHEQTAWEGAGHDNFLTPVYFRREVLDYYLNDPRHYTVSQTQVSAGDQWSIPISITARGNVQVWLGDLGRISERAQHHWQPYAIADDDEVPAWRIAQDLDAQFVSPPRDEGVERVRRAIEECNEMAQLYCGKPLYAEITGMNADRIQTLHTPLNSSLPAFQHQITTLAILIADHLNSDFFSAVGAPAAEGSLNRLAGWLQAVLDVSREEAREVIGGLFAVQAIRSSGGGAHRAGEGGNAALERAQIDMDDLPDGFERLAQRAAESLDNVRDTLNSLPPLARDAQSAT